MLDKVATREWEGATEGTAEAMQLPQLGDHKMRAAPIGLYAITFQRHTGLGRKQTLHQHNAAIQLFRENLKNDSRQGAALLHFPKMRRTPAIVIVIAVME